MMFGGNSRDLESEYTKVMDDALEALRWARLHYHEPRASETLRELQAKLGVAYLFISHDLAVVRHISHQIGVMYLGRIVELADSEELHERPLHPYPQALLSAAPIPDPKLERRRQRIILQGEVPSPDKVYPGCPFADRCPIVEPHCREVIPLLEGGEHAVACHKAERQ